MSALCPTQQFPAEDWSTQPVPNMELEPRKLRPLNGKEEPPSGLSCSSTDNRNEVAGK